VTKKNAVFWNAAPCTSCVNRHFGGMYCLHVQGRKIPATTCSLWFLARGFFYPEDGGDTFLRNVGSHKIYTAPHPRRRHYLLILNFPSVGIATGYGLDGRGLNPGRVDIFLFSTSSRLALGPTQTPIQLKSYTLSPWVKGPGAKS
jgi:hypothetical protein